MEQKTILKGVGLGVLLSTVVACGESDESSHVKVPLEDFGTNVLYARASFNDASDQYRFIVDTGAGYTTVTQSMMDDIGLGEETFTGEHVLAIAADGNSNAFPVHVIPKMTVGDCTVENVEAVVISGATSPLLGGTFFRKSGGYVSVDYDTKTLELSDQCVIEP